MVNFCVKKSDFKSYSPSTSDTLSVEFTGRDEFPFSSSQVVPVPLKGMPVEVEENVNCKGEMHEPSLSARGEVSITTTLMAC